MKDFIRCVKEACQNGPPDVRKSAKYFAYFMSLMLLLTLLSNAASSVTIAKVTAVVPTQQDIADLVEFSGRIEAESKVDVEIMGEYAVQSISHGIGSEIKAGEEILTFNMDNLQEQLETCNLELRQKQVSIQSLQTKNKIADEMEAVNDENEFLGVQADKLVEEEKLQRAIEAAERAYREASRGYRIARTEYDDSGDADDVVDALKRLDKMETRLENAQKEFNQKQKEYMDLLNSEADESTLKAARTRLDAAEAEMANADRQYKDALDNYDDAIGNAGSDSDTDTARAYSKLSNARDSLYKARTDLETAISNQKHQIQKMERNLARQELENQKQQLEREAEKQQNTADIEKLLVEVKELSKESSYLSALIGEKGKLLSPIDGVLIRLEMDSQEWLKGENPIQIATTVNGYNIQAKAYVDSAQELYSPLRVVANISGKEVICSVSNIGVYPNDDQGIDVKLALPEGEYHDGEQVDISFVKTEEKYDLCVPLGAIRKDNESDFVYVIEENKTILGIQSTLRRVPVEIEMKDDKTAAISGAVTGESLIVLSSSKLIGEGDRVRLIEN